MNFKDRFSQYSWEDVRERIYSMTSQDVEYALSKTGNHTLFDFMALVSPAADPYLEQMAQLSHSLTQKRFGNTIQMYIPLYLSNECQNICTYCGFSYHNKIARITLTDEQILNEIKAVKALGYDHVLLVSGEATKTVGADYFKNAIKLIRPFFYQI
jgi:2-iminoacetate synthase